MLCVVENFLFLFLDQDELISDRHSLYSGKIKFNKISFILAKDGQGQRLLQLSYSDLIKN
jgi:hypothetical protein